MANRGRLLGLAFLLVALLYCSGVLSQGLTLERSVSWPWRSSNTTDIYKPEPFIKGDAGSLIRLANSHGVAAQDLFLGNIAGPM